MGLRGAEKIVFVEGNTHKYVAEEGSRDLFCRRAPHGARGLKLQGFRGSMDRGLSRPTRGAWIETALFVSSLCKNRSRPTRGAWIETSIALTCVSDAAVAPHTGRVD